MFRPKNVTSSYTLPNGAVVYELDPDADIEPFTDEEWIAAHTSPPRRVAKATHDVDDEARDESGRWTAGGGGHGGGGEGGHGGEGGGDTPPAMSSNAAHLNEPVGFPISHLSHPGHEVLPASTPRYAAADWLRDHGRDAEADKVQQPGLIARDARPGHIGTVRRGILHPDGLSWHIRAVERHLDEWSNEGHRHPVIDYNGENFGDVHGTTPAQWEAEGTPVDEGSVLVSHAEGQHDSDQPDDYAEWEHDEVPLDRLGDHVADVIHGHVRRQHRNNWGPHNDEESGRVYYDGNSLDNLEDLMGWDISSGGRMNVGGRNDPLRHVRQWYRHGGEGYAGDAEETSRYLSGLQEDLQADLDERNGENREETLQYPHMTVEQLTDAINVAKDAEEEFDDLAKEPDRREEQNENEYERLLKRLRETRPIIADPTDTDDHRKAFRKSWDGRRRHRDDPAGGE